MKREKARFVVSFSASPLMATGDAYFRTEDGGWCSMWNTNESGNGFDELSSEEMNGIGKPYNRTLDKIILAARGER